MCPTSRDVPDPLPYATHATCLTYATHLTYATYLT